MFINSSPLDQFEIVNLIGININLLNSNIALTNIGLYLTLSTIFILIISTFSTNLNKLIPNSWSYSQEILYATVYNIVINQIGYKKGQVYFPFIYTLFVFILVNNLIGLIPYSFSTTSHFALVFFLSFSIVLGATILGFKEHGLRFFALFVPAGCPLILVPLLVLIETISYMARCISLGLRLGANIKRWE